MKNNIFYLYVIGICSSNQEQIAYPLIIHAISKRDAKLIGEYYVFEEYTDKFPDTISINKIFITQNIRVAKRLFKGHPEIIEIKEANLPARYYDRNILNFFTFNDKIA